MSRVHTLWILALTVILGSCSDERIKLEKGAGFYKITKKEVIKFDSLGQEISKVSVNDFGHLSLLAKSGSGSDGSWVFMDRTETYGPDLEIGLGWQVGPSDENRFVMGKVFTLEDWGKKNIRLTYIFNSSTGDREVFHLSRK